MHILKIQTFKSFGLMYVYMWGQIKWDSGIGVYVSREGIRGSRPTVKIVETHR